MKPGNGNPAAPQHTLKILIRDIDEPFFYEVPESEKNRVQGFLNSRTESEEGKSGMGFIVFETMDRQLHVAVAIRYLQLIHFLWDPSIHAGERLEPVRDETMSIYLNGRTKPFEASVDDPVEAAQIVTGLDSEPGFFGMFHSFEDVDGEPVCVRIDQIMLLEISSNVVRDGIEKLTKQG